MGRKENCPRWYEHPGQQMEIESFGEGTVSEIHYNTYTGTISRLLNRGQENAVPLRHLQAITGRPGRVIRMIIEQERRTGTPILADNQTGYYLPATDAETKEFIRSMRHRAREIMKTADAIEGGRTW